MIATRLLEICETIDGADDYQVFVLAEELPECVPVGFGLAAAHYPDCVALETSGAPGCRVGMKFSDFKASLKNCASSEIKFHCDKPRGHDRYWDFADRQPVKGDNWQQVIFYIENETKFVDGVSQTPKA